MSRSVAVVTTNHAARYTGQLVKHFAHRRPTELAADHGWIDFDYGRCTVQAGQALTLTCEGPAKTMAQLQDVVVRHLVRFAFRENELKVEWGPLQN